VCTGLRPGEKLYEELLIDADSKPTIHPLIYRAQEQALSPELLWPSIDAIEVVTWMQDVNSG
jgi:FlaA1/EpsC-like NDP-sugar epimerase